jgi:site-specific recombinase XerD
MSLQKSRVPLREHVVPFLEYCEVEKGLSSNTQRNYHQYLQVFVRWLERTKAPDLLPHDLTADHIWRYRLYLARSYKTGRRAQLSKKSQNYYLIALRAFLEYLVERDIDTLPVSKVKLAKQKDERTVSFLTASDVEKLCATLDTSTRGGLRDRAIVELLFSSGLRIAELTALNVDQLSVLTDGTDDRTYELPIVGKGKRVRTIFISPRAAFWLRTYLSKRHDVQVPLFVNDQGVRSARLSARSIQKMISRTALLAGLSQKVTPHTLRHTFATDLLGHGADLRSVQELLGHANVATTQIYTHVTNKQLRAVHERYHAAND